MALTEEQRKVLSEITPEDGFAYFSGFAEISHLAHAAIYAGNDKFTVVGVLPNGEPISVECDTVDEAAREWKSLFENLDIATILLQERRWRKPSNPE